VAFLPADREFVGRGALTRARAGGGDMLVGLVLEERGVLRSHQAVSAAPEAPASAEPRKLGEVTSGTFSPTLNRSIALARVHPGARERVMVDIRGKQHAARIVKPPFVRNGKVLIEI
jgi:aminomethyltransferase